MSSANKRTEGPDSYAGVISSAAVSFLAMLFAQLTQALAWVGCVVNYRFWLHSASKLLFLSLLKPYSLRRANNDKHVTLAPASKVKQAQAAVASRLPKIKNTRYTPVRLQQAVLGVQRA